MKSFSVFLVDSCEENRSKEMYKVMGDESISQLKRMLYTRTGIEPDRVQLFFQNEPMADNKQIKSFKITEGSIIEYRRMKRPEPLPEGSPSDKEILSIFTKRTLTPREEKLLDIVEVKEALRLMFNGAQMIETMYPNLFTSVQNNENDLRKKYESQIKDLKEMGFTDEDSIIAALDECKGSAERAALMLSGG